MRPFSAKPGNAADQAPWGPLASGSLESEADDGVDSMVGDDDSVSSGVGELSRLEVIKRAALAAALAATHFAVVVLRAGLLHFACDALVARRADAPLGDAYATAHA